MAKRSQRLGGAPGSALTTFASHLLGGGAKPLDGTSWLSGSSSTAVAGAASWGGYRRRLVDITGRAAA
jgi:hypothetical protein